GGDGWGGWGFFKGRVKRVSHLGGGGPGPAGGSCAWAPRPPPLAPPPRWPPPACPCSDCPGCAACPACRAASPTSKDRMATNAATAMTEFKRILNFNLLSLSR